MHKSEIYNMLNRNSFDSIVRTHLQRCHQLQLKNQKIKKKNCCIFIVHFHERLYFCYQLS